MELLFNKSDKALDKIWVNIKRKRQVDSGENRKEFNIRSSEELDLNSFKNDLV